MFNALLDTDANDPKHERLLSDLVPIIHNPPSVLKNGFAEVSAGRRALKLYCFS